MGHNVTGKIRTLPQLQSMARAHHDADQQIVLCHGCFDLVHPGHLRYLQFAREQGDVLIVSLTGDDAVEKADPTRPYIPQELRAENLAAIEFVDHVVIADDPTAEPVIRAVTPDLYIKGKEYEGSVHPGFLAEKQLVEALGGRVLYSSGEVVFSSTTLLKEMDQGVAAERFSRLHRLTAACARWDVTAASVRRLIQTGFRGKRVAVVGDVIQDRYISCDLRPDSGEALAPSVRPLNEASYLGGAAIIAAHLKAMGAEPHLITTVGRDIASGELLAHLAELDVTCTALPSRRKLPTKTRYLVETQKLLKVDQGDVQPLDSASQRAILASLTDLKDDLDAVILVDFGFGTITEPLLGRLLPAMRPCVQHITGDVSGARRSLLALQGADLLTPNERELRSVRGDFEGSLSTVAMSVMKPLDLGALVVTMGSRGCLLFQPRETDRNSRFSSRLRSDYLPALARNAVDPLGAGDALLAASTLALCAGASTPAAAYIGSAAAAVAVAQIGNTPIPADDLLTLLQTRPELQTPEVRVAPHTKLTPRTAPVSLVAQISDL